jgi:hypothetical protein
VFHRLGSPTVAEREAERLVVRAIEEPSTVIDRRGHPGDAVEPSGDEGDGAHHRQHPLTRVTTHFLHIS